MTIAVIGANQGVGKEAVLQALQKNHKVRALSVNTDKLPVHRNLTVIKGSATSPEDVKNVIENTDAVLICIGTKKKKGTTLFSDMARCVADVGTQSGYKGLVLVISGFGVGKSFKYAGFLIKAVVTFFLKDQYRDKLVMEDVFRKSALNWEIMQPGMLSDAPETGKYTTFVSLNKEMKIGKISRADLAHYMLSEAVEQKNIKQTVAITH